MVDYKKLDVIYTTQWPFNHFKLDPSKYINEIEAEDLFESKKYFQAVYFNDIIRIFCIDFRISSVGLTLYEDGGPMYLYEFIAAESIYDKLTLRFIREKHITCSLQENGNAYIVEVSGLLGKDKTYKKKYDCNVCRPIHIAFNQYEDLLKFIEDISINKLLI